MKRYVRAFTLVELLAALAIIALIAALIFPVFARVRESARRRVCISNLHQIGIAVSLYRQDYDGMDAAVGVPLSHSQLGLPHSFSINVFEKQYIKNRQVLFCPSYIPTRPDLGSSYFWGLYDSEFNDPSRNFEAEVAARGEEYPIVLCYSHNGPTDIPQSLRRSSDMMYYHILRLSNQVSIRIARADADPFPGHW